MVFLKHESILKIGNFVGFKSNFRWRKLSVASVELLIRVEDFIKVANSTLRAEEIMVFIAFHKSYLLQESCIVLHSCFCTVSS